MSDIRKISDHSFAAHCEDERVYTLTNRVGGQDTALVDLMARTWEQHPQGVGRYDIVPYGSDNLLPTHLRDIVDENNLVPGIIERQTGLLFGQGMFPYKIEFRDGQPVQVWQEDAEIQAWLDSWESEDYIKGCITDYLHLKGFFDAVYLKRKARVQGTGQIACLEHIPAKNARLEWTDTKMLKDVKHILVGDFENGCDPTGVKVYPVFDPNNPAKYPVAASYSRSQSFGRDFYSVPSFWGTRRWIVRGSEIPLIFKYVTDNGLNLAYHIHSTSTYWDYRRNVLRSQHPDWTDLEVEEEIAVITKKLLESLTQVLTGKENAGKFLHTIDIMDDLGNMTSWKIEAIDQKIKDFVEAQLKISESSVSAITSGMGLHPSLSNIMVNGKLASGSEMLYAFKLYLLTDTEIASRTVLRTLNRALAFNFPGKGLKLGFYHQSLKSEEALSSSDRIKNQ